MTRGSRQVIPRLGAAVLLASLLAPSLGSGSLSGLEADPVGPARLSDPEIATSRCDWRRASPEYPGNRFHPAVAYDEGSDRLIMLSWGSFPVDGPHPLETWSLDPGNGQWRNMLPSVAPLPARASGPVMTYDPTRDVVLLFGGVYYVGDTPVYSDETWSYDLETNGWSRLNLARSPPGRWIASMDYDRNHDRTLLFGGSSAAGMLNDTWALDLENSTWTERARAPSPGRGEIAHDWRNRRTVLHGQVDRDWSDETWIYDHDSDRWTRSTSAARPEKRGEFDTSYDSVVGKVLLFGGLAATWPPPRSVWSFDVAKDQWKNESLADPPPGRNGLGLVYASRHDRTVLVSGQGPLESVQDDWLLDLGNRTWRRSPSRIPWPRHDAAAVIDPATGNPVLFGGFIGVAPAYSNETIALDTGRRLWIPDLGGSVPAPRSGHAMALDTSRGRALMFGGTGYSDANLTKHTYWEDAWLLDPAVPAWTNATEPAGPRGRTRPALVYDESRDLFVMFGGERWDGASRTLFGDTWTYDPASGRWTNITPSPSPSPRSGAAMAFDPASGRSILFSGSGHDAETWAFDASVLKWEELTPQVQGAPQGRHSSSMVYDSRLGRLTMFGGAIQSDFTDATAEIWEFDFWGRAWALIACSSGPDARQSHAMVHDPARGHTFVLAGYAVSNAMNTSQSLIDTWELVPGPMAPSAPRGLKVEIADGIAMLEWGPPIGAVGRNVTGYVVYRSDSGAPPRKVAEVSGETKYLDRGIVAGVRYGYSVSAVSGAGEGRASVEVQAGGPPPGSLSTPAIAALAGAGVAIAAIAAVVMLLLLRGRRRRERRREPRKPPLDPAKRT